MALYRITTEGMPILEVDSERLSQLLAMVPVTVEETDPGVELVTKILEHLDAKGTAEITLRDGRKSTITRLAAN